MALTQVPPALLTSTTGTGTTVALSASPTFTGTVTTPSVTFSDASTQTAAASPYVLKNRIINGAMVIDQRYAGAATANTISGYTIDRWQVLQSTTGKLIAQQNAGSVTPPTGFVNYLGVTSQSAYSVGATDFYLIRQIIEGSNVSDLAWGTANAKTVTISFWVRSSLTGTFGLTVSSYSGARYYPTTYTISAANTWEYKTVTIPGDTSGTWLTNTTGGPNIDFAIGVGSTYSGTANTWGGSPFIFAATGCQSVVGTNGATFYITGVQLEIGTSATPFERRLYTTELQLCQRYFEKSFNISQAVANGTSGTSFISGYGLSAFACSNNSAPGGTIRFAVQKRTDPTMTLYGNNSGQWSLVNPTSSTSISWTTAINLSAGDGIVLVGNYAVNNTLMCVYGHWTASAEL